MRYNLGAGAALGMGERKLALLYGKRLRLYRVVWAGTDQENRSPRRNALRHGIYSNELCFRGEVVDKRSGRFATLLPPLPAGLAGEGRFRGRVGRRLGPMHGETNPTGIKYAVASTYKNSGQNKPKPAIFLVIYGLRRKREQFSGNSNAEYDQRLQVSSAQSMDYSAKSVCFSGNLKANHRNGLRQETASSWKSPPSNATHAWPRSKLHRC